jgi:hypothetical protein
MTGKLKSLLIVLICFLALTTARGAFGATNVYYSVGQNTTDHKTETPTVTVSGTTATFSVAQTATNMGVGDLVTYTGGACYISGKTSTTVWSCTNATGGTPATATDASVTSIAHVFDSLFAAEAGAPTLLGNSNLTTIDVQLNFPCYYDTGADTTAVTIDGYTTGVNSYIKIYTPNNTTTEVNQSQRHDGKWDEGKYSLVVNNDMAIEYKEGNVSIDGLQVKGTGTYASRHCIGSLDYLDNITISNNIVTMEGSGSGNGLQVSANYETNYIYNNIIHNSVDAGILTRSAVSHTIVLFNNTIYASGGRGIYQYANTIKSAINNLVLNSAEEDYFNAFIAASNNISSDATAPGTNSKINITVQFISTEAGSEDFHLADTDVEARDSGVDLSSYGFSTDIDGDERLAGSWDIGADETATRIYRSVGPSNTTALDTDNSHADTITIASGIATFSAEVPDNVGMGDVILYDSDNSDTITSADSLVFIHGRTDGTHFKVRNQAGAVPGDLAINDTYSVYRAYTSLFNAEAGTINSTLSGLGISFTGGNRDLVTNNEQWNIACYGDAVDTTTVVINDWTTSENNFIKIYTPVSLSEVGMSQRHSGLEHTGYWTSGQENRSSIYILNSHTVIDGIEIDSTDLPNRSNGVVISNADYVSVKNSFIHGMDMINANGIVVGGHNAKIVNNIIHDIPNGDNAYSGTGIYFSTYKTNVVIYNNTIANCRLGMVIAGNAFAYVKNNISIGSISGDYGTTLSSYNTSSTNNISSDSTAPALGTYYRNATVQFADIANNDFHLSGSDTSAMNQGTDLSADANFCHLGWTLMARPVPMVWLGTSELTRRQM